MGAFLSMKMTLKTFNQRIHKATVKGYLSKDIRKQWLRRNEATSCFYPVSFNVFSRQVTKSRLRSILQKVLNSTCVEEYDRDIEI